VSADASTRTSSAWLTLPWCGWISLSQAGWPLQRRRSGARSILVFGAVLAGTYAEPTASHDAALSARPASSVALDAARRIQMGPATGAAHAFRRRAGLFTLRLRSSRTRTVGATSTTVSDRPSPPFLRRWPMCPESYCRPPCYHVARQFAAEEHRAGATLRPAPRHARQRGNQRDNPNEAKAAEPTWAANALDSPSTTKATASRRHGGPAQPSPLPSPLINRHHPLNCSYGTFDNARRHAHASMAPHPKVVSRSNQPDAVTTSRDLLEPSFAGPRNRSAGRRFHYPGPALPPPRAPATPLKSTDSPWNVTRASPTRDSTLLRPHLHQSRFRMPTHCNVKALT